MRILILGKFLPKDGATTHMYTLAKGLIEKGNDVYIMSAGPTNDEGAIKIYNESINDRVKHCRISFPCYYKYTLLSKIKQFIRYIAIIPIGLNKIKKINPDIIHVHYPVTSYLANIYCKLYNKKFITTYHIKGITKQILHRKANVAIAISSDMLEELQVRWGYKNEEIHLVFNGVSEEKFNVEVSNNKKEMIKVTNKLPLDKIIIGFVGTYQIKKGIDLLLEACSKINNDKFHIVLVGDGDKEWVNKNINKFNLQDKVTLIPFQNPVDFYSIFDIFVLPSRNEGFGLVAVEAMMQSVPVIRSDTAGAKDMITHRKDGLIFENGNIYELKADLEELINDEKYRRYLGENGKKKALNNFTDHIMVDNMINVYKNVINYERE